MWSAICVDNADHVRSALTAYEERLRQLREAIARGDEPALRSFFTEAREWAEEQQLPGTTAPE
jgi:prephenate dehydrogenase